MARVTMSGTVFFSSPLRPANSLESNPNPFYTPQTKPWGSYATTSSPLQTSKNANVMPQTPCPKNDLENSTSETNQIPKSAANRFFLNPTPPTSSSNTNSSRAAQFQFQARARASSPSVQLQSFTTSKRDSRKQLFLDRLRNKRDDERFERGGDQILRLDYMKERRQWEAEMRRKQLAEVDEMEEDSEMYQQSEEEEPSPTEDKEIEELVSYLETETQIDDDFCDEDYDDLFMEVMSKESQDQRESFDDMSRSKPPPPPDTDMDMS